MQEDFPARKAQYDIELGELDQQINALNNLLGRSVVCVSGDGVSQVSSQIGVVGVQVSGQQDVGVISQWCYQGVMNIRY
jgi:hypothetical protein